MSSEELAVWTVGHSTRSFDEFLELLRAHRIEAIADVRRFPASRRYPQFNEDAMRQALANAGIAYAWMPDLGGRRKPRPDSHNTAWRSDQFRGYADYMETKPFRLAMERLVALAREKRTAIMCAEAVWWRCHRGLIADSLKAAGASVRHIVDARKTEEHPFTPAARLIDGRLSYTPPATGQANLF